MTNDILDAVALRELGLQRDVFFLNTAAAYCTFDDNFQLVDVGFGQR